MAALILVEAYILRNVGLQLLKMLLPQDLDGGGPTSEETRWDGGGGGRGMVATDLAPSSAALERWEERGAL